jgi:hypothetical protein
LFHTSDDHRPNENDVTYLLFTPPLQYSHSIMRLSFNSWELSLTSVMKRSYVLNEIVRRQKRSIYQISLGVLRRIKPIHHLIPENPIERRKMSHNRDDCECFNCAIHTLQEKVWEQDRNNPRAPKLNDQLHQVAPVTGIVTS